MCLSPCPVYHPLHPEAAIPFTNNVFHRCDAGRRLLGKRSAPSAAAAELQAAVLRGGHSKRLTMYVTCVWNQPGLVGHSSRLCAQGCQQVVLLIPCHLQQAIRGEEVQLQCHNTAPDMWTPRTGRRRDMRSGVVAHQTRGRAAGGAQAAAARQQLPQVPRGPRCPLSTGCMKRLHSPHCALQTDHHQLVKGSAAST